MRVRIDCLFRTLSALLATLGVVAGAAPRAHAAAYTYGTRQRTITAGILLVDDAGSNTQQTQNGVSYSVDPDPYVFYILNQRQDLKPFGWNIVNPIAPANVTGDILAAWNARDAGAYQLNQTVTPNMAAYWEVSLSKTSLTNLEKFDVLLVNVSTPNVRFTDAEVNTLRRYVDNGGQLWVEGTGGGIGDGSSAPGYLFLDLSFSTGTDTLSRFLPSIGGYNIPQPIIAAPYLLQPQELNALGTPDATGYDIQGASGSLDTSILSTVAETTTAPVISAGQYGAGQVIVDSVGAAANINNSLPGISVGSPTSYGPNSGPYCDSDPNDALVVPAPDLKFAYDLLSWSSAHPNEHKNSHQSSQTAATVGPSLTTTWTYAPGYTTGATPGAAINGNFVYVRTADGILRAFNATPGTDIIGTGTPDAGYPDYVNGDPYDEVWDTANSGDGFPGTPTETVTDAHASAPTFATVPNNGPTVFIENASGQVLTFNAVTGQSTSLGTLGTAVNPTFAGVAPSPTYFGGRLYAAEPDGSLLVYDFTSGLSHNYDLGAAGEYAVAPPTVGLVHETINTAGATAQNGSGYVDDIVVTVTTDLNTYTVHAGARHDPLQPNTQSGTAIYTPTPANGGAAMPFDILPAGTGPVYSDAIGGYQSPFPAADIMYPTPPTGFEINPMPPTPPVFGDYDVDFTSAMNASPGGSANRAVFGVGAFTPAVTTATISAPALDANGNFYYTANTPTDSTLVCAHEGRSGEVAPSGRLTDTQILWRFRLPTSNDNSATQPDADGVSYALLAGYQFVGAPVVDDQGNVFALATNGTNSAVLCFNATYSPFIQIPVTNANGTVSITQLTQPLTGSAGTDEFGGSDTVLAGTQQFSGQVDNNGDMTIQNFGSTAGGPTGTVITPTLSEPLPVQATYTQSTTSGTTAPTAVTGLFHTNLNWFAVLGTTTASAGLTQVGNYLFFPGTANGASTTGINRLYAYPQSGGLVGGGRQYNTGGNTPDGRPAFQSAATTQVGTVGGILSAGNGVMVANGTAGVQAFGTKYSLVSDANRVLEVDSDGVPSWLVDATSEINTSTKRTTHLALNHPTSITQVTPNDYLIADTGNNRCVRFDRAGNVIWELSRFNDQRLMDSSGNPVVFYTNPASGVGATKAAALLAPGEPTTLNHPTSVASYVQTVSGGTIVHYLIADTGNSRIVEVVDVFDQHGNPIGVPHNLVWVSRTSDALGRHYAYTSANYFVGPGDQNSATVTNRPKTYVIALVSNARIAGPIPAPGQMLSGRQDAPGSSIALLDYDPADPVVPPTNVNAYGQADGYIHQAVSYFMAHLTSTGAFDLGNAPVLEQTGTNPPTYGHATAGGTPTPLLLRNPRFMQTYTPLGSTANGNPQLQDALLADDNGIWDLFFNSGNQLEAQWGFTQVDYQNLPGSIPGLSFDRAGLPSPPGFPISFRPSSLQRTGTDPLTISGTTYLLGHYLATNGFSTGEVTPTSGFGGEVLELGDLSATGLQTDLVSSFGKLGIAAPLSQPTFATHEK